ncbi:chlorophyll synthesis pathway protein BchC [Acuticoccus sp.]|uniref:chlorophyll synthesis pathway protein BchC n=1 Tax=Acuticoccus sp. TaxID=1904378 RepID=UPI003B52CD64
MQTTAIVFDQPGRLDVRPLRLRDPRDGDVVVEVRHSGISTGTERLLWTGRMPAFPGMGYPLVPGYEAVGTVVEAPEGASVRPGTQVFVPGTHAFEDVRCLFGASAAALVVPHDRIVPVDRALGADAALLALAATARHAIADATPDLVVGHGALGRLVARLAVAAGGPVPTVWETEPRRRDGARGYEVVHPDADPRRDYRTIVDVSGDAALVDTLIARLAPGGEVVLAGFYADRIGFAFPPAFMKEARLRIAAQWQPADLEAVRGLVADGTLCLDGIVSHSAPATDAAHAYATAFDDPDCLKMVLTWS